jgi:hypothetical protein
MRIFVRLLAVGLVFALCLTGTTAEAKKRHGKHRHHGHHHAHKAKHHKVRPARPAPKVAKPAPAPTGPLSAFPVAPGVGPCLMWAAHYFPAVDKTYLICL